MLLMLQLLLACRTTSTDEKVVITDVDADGFSLEEGDCDDADASRLGDAKHLGRHLLAHRKRNFVEEIGAGHDVERGVCERKILSLGLHKFRPCDLAPCHCLGELCKVLEVFEGLLEIKGRQV